MVTDIKSSITDITAISDQLKSTANFVKETSGKISNILDCRIFRRQLTMLETSVCGVTGFNTYFTLQAYLLTFLGPLLTILGFCLCFQTCIADRDKDKLPYDDQFKRGQREMEMNELPL